MNNHLQQVIIIVQFCIDEFCIDEDFILISDKENDLEEFEFSSNREDFTATNQTSIEEAEDLIIAGKSGTNRPHIYAQVITPLVPSVTEAMNKQDGIFGMTTDDELNVAKDTNAVSIQASTSFVVQTDKLVEGSVSLAKSNARQEIYPDDQFLIFVKNPDGSNTGI